MEHPCEISHGESGGNGAALAINEMDKIFQTATIPVFAVDSTGVIKKWYGTVVSLTGLQAAEVLGKSIIDEVLHPDYCASFRHCLFRAVLGDKHRKVELKLKSFGQDQFVSVVASPCCCKDYTENAVWVWFLGQDVTNERMVRDKFDRLENDYKAFAKCQMLPPIFISDYEGQCTEWNPAMEKLTGWGRSDVIGKILPGEIFGKLCRLQGDNDGSELLFHMVDASCISFYEQNVPFSFYNREGQFVENNLFIETRVNTEGERLGSVCILQTKSVASSSSSNKGFEFLQ